METIVCSGCKLEKPKKGSNCRRCYDCRRRTWRLGKGLPDVSETARTRDQNLEERRIQAAVEVRVKEELKRLSLEEGSVRRKLQRVISNKEQKVREQGWLGYSGSITTVTGKSYLKMLERQGNVCAICGKNETIQDKFGKIRKLSIDHCHTTKLIRGLLCGKCNMGLGLLQDSVEILSSAISYLQNPLHRDFEFVSHKNIRPRHESTGDSRG